MRIKIPTVLIEKINYSIDIDSRFINIDENRRIKLVKVLLEFWYFIYMRQVEDTTKPNLDFYINIHSRELNRFNITINKQRLRYNDLFTLLEDTITINTSEDGSKRYKGGSFTCAYKINTEFISISNMTEIELDTELIFSAGKDKKYWIKKYKNYKHLIEDCYNTEIKLDEYLYWLNNNIGKKLAPVFNKQNGKIESRFLTPDRAFYHFNLALKVNIKKLWFKLSNEGRFYSSITNLPKVSIPFIKLYNREVVSIDLKNCQPLLLNTIIDHKDFREDCSNGQFYDELLSVFSLGRENTTREMMKLLCYKYIFFGSNPLKSGKLFEALEVKYPGLISKINNIKEEYCLAKRLQQIESDIFVDYIGKIQISKLLRHDEVLVHIENVDRIKDSLRRRLSNKIKK